MVSILPSELSLKFFDSLISTFPKWALKCKIVFKVWKNLGHRQTRVSQANLLNKWQHQIKDISDTKTTKNIVKSNIRCRKSSPDQKIEKKTLAISHFKEPFFYTAVLVNPLRVHVSVAFGSPRNEDDDNGNDNVNKAIARGLMRKLATFYVAHTFWFIY